MGKISEIFNFDNIGGKIKNLAKWSCWITILLIWIAAPIAFITLVADDWTAELCWIPLVGAVVGPVIIWLGSWAMYAFGEFVEDVHTMRNGQCATTQKSTSPKGKTKPAKKETPTVRKTIDERTADEIFNEDNYVDIVCPRCKENLSFLKDEANAICPWCETKITL